MSTSESHQPMNTWMFHIIATSGIIPDKANNPPWKYKLKTTDICL